MIDLDDRVAAVTGASSGIGEAVARRLAAEGASVAIGARRVKELEAIAEDADGDLIPIELDVRDWDSVQAFAETIEAERGELDVLVANAGTGGYGEVEDLDLADWEETIQTNLTGVFQTCKACLPLMRPRDEPGTIVATASVSGTMGMAGASAYCASKWGVRGFVQSLAEEVAGDGIRATAINPGYVATRWHEDDPRADEMIQPEDLADLVCYLARMPETAQIDDVTVWPSKMYDE